MAKIKFDAEGKKEDEYKISSNKEGTSASATASTPATSNGTTHIHKKRIYFDPDNPDDQEHNDTTHQTHKNKARRKAHKNVDFELRNRMLEVRKQLPIWSGGCANYTIIMSNIPN